MTEDAPTLAWEPAPGQGPQVRYAVDGPLGRVRLDRPHAINALDRAAVDSLRDQLGRWAQNEAVAAVVVEGAGDRGLCAGGDVRALREAILAGDAQQAADYWQAEYALNALIATYPKPYVAWMDGVVMGGGVGISAHGSLRLVTERTRLAMPETIIGFFPDVGGVHLLARAPGQTGTHVALTGTTVSGADALLLGMADALVSSSAATHEQVLAALRDEPGLDAAALADQVGGSTTPEESWLARQRPWIDACYVGDDAAEVVTRLRERPEPEAREAAEQLTARSPYAVAVTLEALRRAAGMTLAQVLAQDAQLGPAFAAHPDFVEGVRAQLVDKDRSPRWQHASLAQVTRAEVLAAFGEHR